MKDIKVMFRSISDCWATPNEVFDKYDAIYHFETNVCATADNTKCDRLQYDNGYRDGMRDANAELVRCRDCVFRQQE